MEEEKQEKHQTKPIRCIVKLGRYLFFFFLTVTKF